MKICFIGTCGHTKQAYRYLKTRTDVSFCGVASGSVHENLHESFDPAIPFYADYMKMLDEVCPDLAVVSPVFALTGQVILACAVRGIHVFSEKPVATTREELMDVRRAVTDSGIRFSAMHYLRYDPAFYHGAELVRSGRIGDLRLITTQKSYRYGTRPAWYGDRRLYGGTIPWVGIHAIDWIYHFSGKRFLSVSAQSFGKDPEMAALCCFELEDGLMASMNLDFYRPKAAPSHGDDRIRCVGTCGILEVTGGKIHLIDESGESVTEPPSAPELLEEFLEGRTPIAPEEIFYLTDVSLATREAADSGRMIRFEAF